MYAEEDKFLQDFYDKGNIGLIRFDSPPKVTFGKERLVNYTTDKARVGAVFYRVIIDSLGNHSCLHFVNADNSLLIEQANQIVNTLKFHPAILHGKGIWSTMYITVRFNYAKLKKLPLP